MIETKRLILRELTHDDYNDLCEILQDPITMTAYEHAFSDEEVIEWIDRQLDRYKKDGIGLWAVILKETGDLIGQCGLTMQDIPDNRVVEIGYLFNRSFWHNGFAIEAAKACKDYAFNTLGLKEVYSIIRDNNSASINVALNNGMNKVGEFIKHYQGMDMEHVVYKASQTFKPHYEVASAYIEKDGKFLITKRKHKIMDNIWEFPGGKIENSEFVDQAILREIKEELGVNISIINFISSIYHEYSDFSITLYLLKCRIESGELELSVHSDLAWISSNEIDRYELAEADYKLLKKVGENHGKIT